MQKETLFYIIILILSVQFLLDTFLNYINAKAYKDHIPEELKDTMNPETYSKSVAYKKANYNFGLLTSTLSFVGTLLFLLLGGFKLIDEFARSFTDHPILIALVFFGCIMFISDLLGTPFSYYQNFVIEEKFGFNKSTVSLFFIDKLKGYVLAALVGGGLLSLIIWFFIWAGPQFWWYAWIVITLFTLLMNMFYSSLIVPLFNKQTTMDESSLRQKIEGYAKNAGFTLNNIFIIDGSKRSSKANAYFSGFGNQKRITLYDTLLQDLEEEEIVAVLAHEVGHYKHKHIIVNMGMTLLIMGATLYLLSLFVNYPEMSLAIGVSQQSFHAALIAFGILYSPISELTGLIMNYISRKFEYQADNYAKNTYGQQPLISALKKLSKNSLSNLTPHPTYVFVHYSHPPLLARIRNLKSTK